MLLARDGKLRYDAHLNDFFPQFPAYGKSITVRNLLNHTSGLPDYEDLLMKQYPDIPEEKRSADSRRGRAEVGGAREPRQVSRRGQKWEYSNSGYALLAMIVEQGFRQEFRPVSCGKESSLLSR